MSRTIRNDMGIKMVHDGKTYMAMMERLDPWNKEYYNAKGMKKKRQKEMQWELRNISFHNAEYFITIKRELQRFICCGFCKETFTELMFYNHNHITSSYISNINNFYPINAQ